MLSPDPLTLSEAAFVENYGALYESSPWVASRAYGQLAPKHQQVPAMQALLASIVDAASEAEQLALIKAHPDLAGKAAEAGTLTESSTAEQKGAGLDRLSAANFARFQQLNGAYQQKFGFPFIIAVRGLNADDILAAFEVRLNNTQQEERQTALVQIHKIAALRLALMEQ